MQAMPRAIAAVVVALVVVVVLVGGGGPVSAQGTTTPPTSAGYGFDRCVSALPPPDCDEKPEASGDRGGWAQLLLFGVVTAGMAGIAVVIIRSTIRRDRAHRVP
jgi:hypothetical protein